MNETIRLLKSHRSIRRFKPDPVPDEMARVIIETAQCASTSHHIQAYSIIRVDDPGMRKELRRVSGDQQWVEKCPLLLMFCADLDRPRRACEKQGTRMAEGYAELFVIATVDAALAAQNTMIAAESLGLGGVFIGGMRNDPQTICELLDLPRLVYPVFGMCLGYPDESPGCKPRLPLDVVFKNERYDAAADADKIDSYDAVVNEYYRTRSANSRDDNWTRQIASMTEKPLRTHMKGFLESRGFLLK